MRPPVAANPAAIYDAIRAGAGLASSQHSSCCYYSITHHHANFLASMISLRYVALFKSPLLYFGASNESDICVIGRRRAVLASCFLDDSSTFRS